MSTRILGPEKMDDPELDRASHEHALRGLRRINRWTGNVHRLWQPIHRLANELRTRRLRILDVATGAADIPIGLWRCARQHGLDLDLSACDRSPQAIAFATESCAEAGAPIRLFSMDVLDEPHDETYDLVMCSQFLHHLTNAQAEQALRRMAAMASHRVVVVDLVRSRWNWLQVWFASHVLSRSSIVHYDGPQSIRAAFTPSEIQAVAHDAHFARIEITQHWPCRFVLVGSVHSGKEH